ncbi:hypothetical protein JRO89_XS13G0080700 [Xanthoceras sorbifolium]|uniref:RIN4 pathogenic type III effector avirulence factor Avr cleavage site domain-containing protein n=1 Tax=Xanthoceras sorbifolium TaxID=99658 RepID=A0ABQ8H777_9ROSI|nr:hypothetical protein JRO89_XS13G0080700 [Xanthoceras sorbifolium]
MASQDKGRPLPKFGEWDVNNPASAEAFTVIFNKARDEKKTKSTNVKIITPKRNDIVYKNDGYQYPRKKFFFWFLSRKGGFAVVEFILLSGLGMKVGMDLFQTPLTKRLGLLDGEIYTQDQTYKCHSVCNANRYSDPGFQEK